MSEWRRKRDTMITGAGAMNSEGKIMNGTAQYPYSRDERRKTERQLVVWQRYSGHIVQDTQT